MISVSRSLALGMLLLVVERMPAQIELIGIAKISGTATDLSGLRGSLGDGTPHDRFGSHGSAIAYTGYGNRYVMLSDRGPQDGAVSYQCRFHLVDIELRPGEKVLSPTLVATRILKTREEQPYVGLVKGGPRLDPEGVRVSREGRLLISEEYGPHIVVFDPDGRQVTNLEVPQKFRGVGEGTGRQDNRGFEGIAITPDGKTALAALQGCLLQDGTMEADRKQVRGTNVRILELDLTGPKRREFVYVMDSSRNGLNEILAINDREFLILERDNRGGKDASVKRIYRIDIREASDVRSVEAFAEIGLPKGIKPVRKEPFLDLLDPRFGLAGPDFPAKIEGLAFGPDLPDGRRLLLVTSDNDFKAKEASQIWAFAIPKAELPGYVSQVIDTPLAGPK